MYQNNATKKKDQRTCNTTFTGCNFPDIHKRIGYWSSVIELESAQCTGEMLAKE